MVALKNLDLGIKVSSAGFLFFVLGPGDKMSLESLAIEDFAFFDLKVSSSSCLFHLSGTFIFLIFFLNIIAIHFLNL